MKQYKIAEKYEGWLNLYVDCERNCIYAGDLYSSKEEAENKINPHSIYFKTIKVEWEE